LLNPILVIENKEHGKQTCGKLSLIVENVKVNKIVFVETYIHKEWLKLQ
jgi:hypothetical protein